MGKPLRSGEGAVIAELDFSLIDNSAGEAGIACWTKLEITPPSFPTTPPAPFQRHALECLCIADHTTTNPKTECC
jgi:hypothetical protein